VVTINFIIAAIFAGASGAFALMAQRHIDPQFAYWTRQANCLRGGARRLSKRRRGVRRVASA